MSGDAFVFLASGDAVGSGMRYNPVGGQMHLETWKRAQNLQVASIQEGAFVGRLDDFVFDLETHRIYGWRLKGTGVFGRAGGVSAEDLLLVGRDVALIRTDAAVEWSNARVGLVDGRSWASGYRGTQAVSRRGRSLGAVQDFVIDRQGNQVTGLLLHGGLLLPLDGRVSTGPAAVIAMSEDIVVEMPEDEGGEQRVDWWNRLASAIGVRRGAAIEENDTIDVTDAATVLLEDLAPPPDEEP